MARPPISKMKRADVIEELHRLYDMDEPSNHNVQMLKSILTEQRAMRQTQSIFPTPMPTRKTDIIKALKEEGYDMTKLNGRENNGLLQRILLSIRQHNKISGTEDSQEEGQALGAIKYIHAWERFALDILFYNRSKESLTETMNEDRLPTDGEVIHNGKYPPPEPKTSDTMPLWEKPPDDPSSAFNQRILSQWSNFEDSAPERRGVAINRFLLAVRMHAESLRAENQP